MKPSREGSSWTVTLRWVGLLQSEYLSLRLEDRLNPFTWSALPSNGRRVSLFEVKHARDFFTAVLPDAKDVYVSIEQEANGEHKFISLKDAKAALLGAKRKEARLKTYGEHEVKRLRDLHNLSLLYAQPEKESATRRTTAEQSKRKEMRIVRGNKPVDSYTKATDYRKATDSDLLGDSVGTGATSVLKLGRAKEEKVEEANSDQKRKSDIDIVLSTSGILSSSGWSISDDLSARVNLLSLMNRVSLSSGRCWSNYSICPEVSLGPNQKLILSDESTLCSVLPDEKIFEHLVLIVNCHEAKCLNSKYKIGSCATNKPPAVICNAVHKWHCWGGPEVAAKINALNHKIQESIWKHLQEGTVAVHCLAGIHRAACIVACHFLYRYYHLKHRDIPHKSADIYRCLQAVRPAVSPAYRHVLSSYEEFLQKEK